MLAVMLLIGSVAGADGDIERGFRNPPESAKPQVWWHWMNGNITKEGITVDLEAMKRVGLGGAQIFNADQGTPEGSARFMTEPWRQLTRHALAEADRLGLELGLHNCAGWSSSGGPWITPEHSMQTVVTSEQTVQGPAHFSAVLPKPKVFIDYYRDIAVLAFRTPRGESGRVKDCAPKVTASTPEFDAAKIMDGDLATQTPLPMPAAPLNPYVQFEFAQPFAARTLTLGGNLSWTCELQVSDDGTHFKTIRKFVTPGAMALQHLGLTDAVDPIRARFYRVEFPRQPGIQIAEVNLSERLSVEKFDVKVANCREIGFNAAPEYSVRPDNVALSAGQSAPEFAVPREGVVDLTSRMAPDGRLDWEVPPGQWTILRLGHTPTRSFNHPAAAGGMGPECDKLSKAGAEAHWAGMMQTVISDAGLLTGKSLNNVLIDSYEVGSQNWTADFRAEFLRRRGYDLGSFLPVLSNRIVASPEITERFLWDFRRTIADLFTENYYGHFATMAHRSGLQFAAEAYGMGNFDELASGGAADIPMGEFWAPSGIGGSNYCKLAAASAHTYGRKIAAAEAFTGGGKWPVHPFACKAGGDYIFSLGINRFHFHRYAMQPWTHQAPGMTLGQWGSNFERTNTWWEQSSAWMRYLARCQFLLQEGTFTADLCFLGGEDYLAGLQIPPQPSLPTGYDYDLCDRRKLLEGMKVENGLFTFPSGMRYRFLVLPDSKALTLPVVKKVRDLVAAGGTVIGSKPLFSPSLENYPACEAELRKIADEVWGPCDGKTVTENRYGKGRVIWGQSYTEIFASAKLQPDFSFTSASPGARFNTIHRTSKEADWYFVSNADKSSLEAICSFRITGKRPEFWYPDTGKIEPVAWYRIENGQTFVPMRFDPFGSVFVVFRSPSADSVVSVARDGKPIAYDKKEEGAGADRLGNLSGFGLTQKGSGVDLTAFTPGRYEFAMTSEKKAEATIDLPSPLAVEGPWAVQFDAKWGGPATPVTFEHLEDWSKRPEEGIKYFSGTAVYEKEFEVPEGYMGTGRRLWLDLGRVEVIAEVEVNGKNLGILWKPPFAADMTDAIKPGKNTVKIRVTNLWPNRLIGDEHLPADCEYGPEGNLKAWPDWLTKNTPRISGRRTFTTWRHWKAEDPLLPSGLLGPVRLVPTFVETLNFKKGK